MLPALRLPGPVALAMTACVCAGSACSAPASESPAPASEPVAIAAPAAPEAPTTPPTPEPTAAPAAPAPTAAPSAPTAAPSVLPDKAEVEFAGTLAWPKAAKGTPTVYVMDGSCFARTAFTIAVVGVSPDGSFGSEIFVPQRTKLWLCGALVAKNGDITAVGEAAGMPFLAEGAGEVIIPRATIGLTRLPQAMKPPRALDPGE